MQRTTLAWISIATLAACGGAAQPATNVGVAPQPTASATATAATAAPHAPLGIPHGAPLVVAFDAGTALGLAAGARAEIEHELGLPDGALGGDLSELGVDAKRPMVFAFAPLDEAGAKIVDELGPAAARAEPNAANEALERIRSSHFQLATRVLVPSSEPKKLASSIESLLAKAKWEAVPGGFARRHTVARVSSDASWVALDVGGELGPRASFATLESVMGGPQDAPPSLDGGVVHATWSPAETARVGFLMSMSVVTGAVSGGSIDPSQRARIVAEGLKEASSLFALGGTRDKAMFTRLDVRGRVSPFELTLRAEPAAGVTIPPDATWSPSPSVAIGGAQAQVAETRAFHDAWNLPAKVMTLGRDGGWMAWFAGLPQALLAAPREIPGVAHAAGPSDEVASHFERVGEAWNDKGDELWFGVLPAKTSRADALCSLTVTTKCAAKDRVALGKVAKKGHGFAKLVELDHRYVLLLAEDAATLAAPVKARAEGPLHLDAVTKALVAAMGGTAPLPDRVVGDVQRDGGALVFRLAPP